MEILAQMLIWVIETRILGLLTTIMVVLWTCIECLNILDLNRLNLSDNGLDGLLEVIVIRDLDGLLLRCP